jgi:hypothetical protein
MVLFIENSQDRQSAPRQAKHMISRGSNGITRMWQAGVEVLA